MMRALLASLSVASFILCTDAFNLTTENFYEHAAGKSLFIKFFAPWCSHCKTMKPAWDKLMDNWNQGERTKTTLIADVDCTEKTGRPVCDGMGVNEGFPTIKWGDVSNMTKYDGPRDYNTLKKFAEEKLKPLCSPRNLDSCDDEQKKMIAEIQAMSAEDLEKKVEETRANINSVDETFTAETKKLDDKYEKLQKEKDEFIAEVKKSGLALMQAVQAHGQEMAKKKKRLAKKKQQLGL